MKKSAGRRSFSIPRNEHQDIALIACASRALFRDAVFLWTIFLSAMRSITACCACISLVAAALSPASTALRTFLTAVRSADFKLALCRRVVSACRARFRAWAVFAMRIPLCWRSKKRPGIIAIFCDSRKLKDAFCTTCAPDLHPNANAIRRAGKLPPMNLLRALSTVSALTLLSRITGLIRESLKAVAFGAGLQMDAFEAAFRLPNILRRLFAEGAFSQAFVPILAEYKRSRGDGATRDLVGRVGTLLAVLLIAISVLGIFGAPWLVYALAGGFAKTPGKVELTAELIRIMFPYIVFVSLVSLAGGVLNIHRNFAIPAFTPVLLNVSIIGAAIFAAPHFDPPIVALAWGVALGGVAQLALQIRPLWRLGMLPRLRFDWRDEGVRRVLSAMGPAVLGVSAAQISALINTQLAAYLGDGRISWITYADRLMEFPSALLGVALGTVLLPSLSKHHHDANHV